MLFGQLKNYNPNITHDYILSWYNYNVRIIASFYLTYLPNFI